MHVLNTPGPDDARAKNVALKNISRGGGIELGCATLRRGDILGHLLAK